MVLQAAKIIGSGLATIGLNNSLFSPLTNILLSPLLSNNLLTKLFVTKLGKNAIHTIDNMIKSLSLDSLLYNFIEEELPNSFIYVNGKIENNRIIGSDFIYLLSERTSPSHNNFPPVSKRTGKIDFSNKIVPRPDFPFHIAGVYIFRTLTNEEYVGSTSNLYVRLSQHIHE